MVKFKNELIYFQILFAFLIPITPHLYISDNLQLDDIPVLVFFLLFICNIYLKNIKIVYFNKLLPIFIFTTYIFVQNIFINEIYLFTEGFRYLFYITLFVTLLNCGNLNKFDSLFKYLTIFVNIFSILFFILQINFGTDLYDYWKIGFNENQWVFTDGRMNGLQAGGPNAFGGLIVSLNLYCIANSNSLYTKFFIATGILACFFTYSRAALIIMVFSLVVYLFISKKLYEIVIVTITLLVTLNFGLIERISSEEETEGIQDRIEMQQAAITDLSERNIVNSLFGYGHGNFGIVRDEVRPILEFEEGLRPTGPHNSFLFIILDYGLIGLFLFFIIFLSPFLKFVKQFKNNLLKSEYLFLGSFVALAVTGDFIQNHSVSVLFFLVLFKLQASYLNE